MVLGSQSSRPAPSRIARTSKKLVDEASGGIEPDFVFAAVAAAVFCSVRRNSRVENARVSHPDASRSGR